MKREREEQEDFESWSTFRLIAIAVVLGIAIAVLREFPLG